MSENIRIGPILTFCSGGPDSKAWVYSNLTRTSKVHQVRWYTPIGWCTSCTSVRTGGTN
ncbi:hypothetical protein BCEP4_1080038 [Burkholderia cepacia]|nr:hypothetical protein BCEP4_1080038 [Burkholderia cepacia]